MNTNHIVACASAFVVGLIACASDAPPAPDARPATSEPLRADASVQPEPDAGSAALAAALVTDAGADAAPACHALGAKACLTCCDLAYPEMAAGLQAAITQCACVKPGECAAECRTTVCAGKNASAACTACIQKAQTCAPASATACKSSPTCSTYLTCLDSCAP